MGIYASNSNFRCNFMDFFPVLQSEGPIFYTDAGACVARGGLCTLAPDCPQRVEGAEEGLCGPREDRTCCQTRESLEAAKYPSKGQKGV